MATLGSRRAAHALLLTFALLLLVDCRTSSALRTYGPFTSAPAYTSICPRTCKIRDVSTYGRGNQFNVTGADDCIRKCIAQGNGTHYSYSTLTGLCGCGNCTQGFTIGTLNTGVVSGRLSACQVFPSCSRIITAKRPVSARICPTGTVFKKYSTFKYQCCCINDYPVVANGLLNSCSDNGA